MVGSPAIRRSSDRGLTTRWREWNFSLTKARRHEEGVGREEVSPRDEVLSILGWGESPASRSFVPLRLGEKTRGSFFSHEEEVIDRKGRLEGGGPSGEGRTSSRPNRESR